MVVMSRQLPYTVVPASPRRCAAREVKPPHTAKLEPKPSMNSTSPMEATSIALTTVPQSVGFVLTVTAGPTMATCDKTGLRQLNTLRPSIASAIIGVGVFRNRRIRSASDHVFTLELFRGGLIRLFQRSISA